VKRAARATYNIVFFALDGMALLETRMFRVVWAEKIPGRKKKKKKIHNFLKLIILYCKGRKQSKKTKQTNKQQ